MPPTAHIPAAAWLLPLALAACGRPPSEGNVANAANAAPAAIEETAIPEDGDATILDNDAARDGAAPTDAATAADATQPTDARIGRWSGPEGLFLAIARGDAPGRYRLTIRDTLDTQGDYAGVAADGGIRFRRAGRDMAIRAGTGAETGFKWLADRRDCLIIVAGKEGYCR